MRRWVLIAATVLVVAAVAGIALVVMGLDAYLDRNRDWLAAQAEAAIGREVRFEGIGVTFSGALAVTIDGLEVADDPAFSKNAFLTADRVVVAVRLWPALFGRYEVERVGLIRPEIRLIQNASGSNTDSLGATSAAVPADPAWLRLMTFWTEAVAAATPVN